MRFPVLPAILLLLVSAGRADVSLAPAFSDHAVLQRDKPVPVWGHASVGEIITVTFRGQSLVTAGDADGRWSVTLAPIAATAESSDLVVTGTNSIALHDVVVGEVWLASGQSNMEFLLAKAHDAEKEIAAANYPLLRHLRIEHNVASKPMESVKSGGWECATPLTAGTFTAVGYFFARDLHRKLGVPVGIIHSAWGGTAIESWISGPTLRKSSAFLAIDARWQKSLSEFPERQLNYPAERVAWLAGEEKAKATKTKNLAPWPRPIVGPGTQYEPSGLFNGMISPLQPAALRGVIWYQGESNATRAGEYAELFPAMISSWRAGFGGGELPFFFVQIANYASPGDPSGCTWAALREAQTKALALPGTGMAVAIDIGNAKDIHPTNKQDVGHRLALIALAKVYDLGIDCDGPVFAGSEREGGALRLHFKYVATGLVAHDKPVQSLEVAGADKVFHPAMGKIAHDTLLVTSPLVKEPVAVRYAWSNSPEANLYNGSGLPAAPFRSDNW